MASSERVLTGRRVRPIDAWPASANWGAQSAPLGAVLAAPAAEPDPSTLEAARSAQAAQAQLLEARRVAEELGFAEGRARGVAELAAAVEAAAALARRLETAIPRDVEMTARTVAELAVAIARRVLAAELRHDPSVLVSAIEAGLAQAAGASQVTVEVHPTALEAVEAAWATRHGSRHRGLAWSFAGDPTLPPGGCRLRTEHGFVEAGLDEQLAQVEAALDAAIPGYVKAVLEPEAEPATAQAEEPATAPADIDPEAAS